MDVETSAILEQRFALVVKACDGFHNLAPVECFTKHGIRQNLCTAIMPDSVSTRVLQMSYTVPAKHYGGTFDA
jgi:hypothetical protein